MRSFIDSLLHPVNKISEINEKLAQIDKEKLKNKITDNMRSMTDSLLHPVNKVSEINKKVAQIDKKKLNLVNKILENKFTGNMRSIIDSLLQHVNKIMLSESDKKISQEALKNFLTLINYVIKILINLICY